MKRFKFLGSLILALAISMPAFGQQPPDKKNNHTPPPYARHRDGKKSMMHKKGKKRIKNYLDLSDQQVKNIKNIMLKNKKSMLTLRNKMRLKKAELKTHIMGKNVDFNAAKDVVDDISSLMAQMIKARLDQRQQIRDLLNDDQQVKFDSRGNFMMGSHHFNFGSKHRHSHRK